MYSIYDKLFFNTFFFLYQGFKAKYKYMMKVKSTTAMLAKFYVPENQ